jgi:hypothetical protein
MERDGGQEAAGEGESTLDSRDTRDRWTPLSWPVAKGHMEVVRLLELRDKLIIVYISAQSPPPATFSLTFLLS